MTTTLMTSDGIGLEARWDLPDGGAIGTVILCHPHPLMGGSMQVPLISTVGQALAGHGLAVLRFNFRGVGRSEGRWSGGDAEIEDVDAAVAAAAAAHPGIPSGLAGWSFGAQTALRWQARTGDRRRYAGIAPPIVLTGAAALPSPEALAPADRLFVIGDRDQLTPVDDLRTYARNTGARLEVLPGSDHFFHFREARVARLLIGHFTPAGSDAE
jgi:alpha/beta superfamily hydrolase